MAINNRTTVVGVFRDRSMAEQAMEALANAGFDPGNIRFSGTGATGSFFDGIKSLFAGPTATESGIASDLNEMGLSDEEAQYYSGEHTNGHTILAVKAEGREQEANSIMQQFGGYNYNAMRNPQVAANYAQQPAGYTAPTAGYASHNSYAATDPNSTDPLRDENATDPLAEERARSIADEPTQVYPPRAQSSIDKAATNEEKAQDHLAQADMKQEQADSNQAEGHPVRAAVNQAQAHHEQAQADREQGHAANQYAQATHGQGAAYDARATQPVAAYQTETERVAQVSDTPANRDARDTRMEDLQAQFQTMQQQLQEAQNQLKTAKEREQELRTVRERETQYQSMQQQFQEMQKQLQATQAELRETQARISQYNS